MPRALRFALLALLLAVGAAATFGLVRNPERATIDAAARDTVSGKFVTLRDGVTHYELAGPADARLVVLVHGFSVPAYIWDSTFTALTGAGYRVLRYDLFGRGWSDRPDVAYDGTTYDEQLNGLLDSLHIAGPVDLVGVSFGGFVTSHFAGTHPARVNTLTLVDPMSQGRNLPGMLTTPVIGPWIWQTTQVPGMADNQASDFLHPEQFPGWADKYRVQMRYRGFGRALLRSAAATAAVNFDTLFAGVGKAQIPTLLIWGKQDQTVPIDLSVHARNNIPGLEWFPVDSSGHLPHMEQSATVHAKLLQFFTAHPVTSARRS
jgi:pimeloyl-ACP methyl ester carboxylesterase